MKVFSLFVSVVALLILLCGYPVLSATTSNSMGSITDFTPNGDIVDISTSSGAVVRVEVLDSDLFRIWVGPEGTPVDEGSNTAPIVIQDTFSSVNARLEETDESLTIFTSDFSLRIQRSPLIFALYLPDGKTLIWRELKPLHLSEKGSYQTLSSTAEERFFGGGQQNGSPKSKGSTIPIICFV